MPGSGLLPTLADTMCSGPMRRHGPALRLPSGAARSRSEGSRKIPRLAPYLRKRVGDYKVQARRASQLVARALGTETANTHIEGMLFPLQSCALGLPQDTVGMDQFERGSTTLPLLRHLCCCLPRKASLPRVGVGAVPERTQLDQPSFLPKPNRISNSTTRWFREWAISPAAGRAKCGRTRRANPPPRPGPKCRPSKTPGSSVACRPSPCGWGPRCPTPSPLRRGG